VNGLIGIEEMFSFMAVILGQRRVHAADRISQLNAGQEEHLEA
jgi:hypothetical protein